jgi:hypothetical protein
MNKKGLNFTLFGANLHHCNIILHKQLFYQQHPPLSKYSMLTTVHTEGQNAFADYASNKLTFLQS